MGSIGFRFKLFPFFCDEYAYRSGILFLFMKNETSLAVLIHTYSNDKGNSVDVQMR